MADQGAAGANQSGEFMLALVKTAIPDYSAKDGQIMPLSVDSAGNLRVSIGAEPTINIGQVSPIAIATATPTNVSAANADTQLLAANSSRKPGSTIVNDSTAILYIKLGTGASATSYWVAIDGKTTVPGVAQLPDGYTGVVNGFWASATGAARITEMA